MNKAKLEKLASELWELERKCQEEGLSRTKLDEIMDEQFSNLSFQEILQLGSLMKEQCNAE